MKKKWILFRKLMQTETGIAWNPIKNSFDASDEWWEKNKLLSDVAATGVRARPPSQISKNEFDSRDKMLEDDGESNRHEEEQVEISDSDYTEDIGIAKYNTNSGKKEVSIAGNEVMFPSLETIKRKYSGEQSKGKKKIFGAASLKEDINSLLQFMENKSSATSIPSTIITIGAAIEILSNIPRIEPRSDLWNYACHQFLEEVLHGHEIRCYQAFRLVKSAFLDLCHELTHKYNVQPTRGMSVYEEVGIFLMICAHGVDNRLMQEIFNHSGETISRHFHRDCIGAIDGTHVKALLPQGQAIPYMDKAFQIAEDESYEPCTERVTETSNRVTTVEDEGNPRSVYWMALRDSIAIKIARRC
ncbi:UNVERIFIED_CONTAM: hypothetical protein Slati_2668300 [Sesamum latifolium]|uniref:DUF8040 domain-containing protein n=1 Tax=Sesamum latifolium TaxID=2727402 RepID=A0AAW2VWR2_9LAMI